MGTEQDNQLSEKLARTFAETGFRDLFLMIHELVIKHYDQESTIKLRGKYVQVNPTEWKKRYNMSIVVGLGTDSKDREMGQLREVIADQKEHLMNGSPLVTLQNNFNAYSDLLEVSDLKGQYYTDPESPEAQQAAQAKAQQPPPEDPNMIMIQQNKAIEDQKAQLVQQKQQSEAFFKKQEQDLKARELSVREVEAGLKTELEIAKIEQGRYEAELKAETTMAVEQLKMGMTIEQAMSSQMSDLSVENDERLTMAINSVLAEINTLNGQNMEGMEGIANGLNEQVEHMASQMNRPKRVIYAEDGETPIGVETV